MLNHDDARRQVSLRSLVDMPGMFAFPVAFDVLSARVAVEAGFDVLGVGSQSLTASKYGLPDLGYMSLNDLAECVRNIRHVLPSVALIADAEAGFGNPVHTTRAVRMLEDAGASGLHIEDHLFGKHASLTPWMESAEVTADKIAAAVAARTSDELLVIGRTDTQWARIKDGSEYGASFGIEEVISRSNLFAEAGADMVLLPATAPEDLETLVNGITVPVMSTSSLIPDAMTVGQLAATGLKSLMYPDLLHAAAIAAMREVVATVRADGHLANVRSRLTSPSEVEDLVGVAEVREIASRYSLF